MGADLYLEPGHEQHRREHEPAFNVAVAERDKVQMEHGRMCKCNVHKRHQRKVEKYFGLMNSSEYYYRDAYNCFSTLNAFGLSWWQDVAKCQSGSGNISKAKARELAERIQGLKLAKTEYNPRDWDHSDFNGKQVNATIFKKQIIPYWEKDRDELVKFLLDYANSTDPLKAKLYASL